MLDRQACSSSNPCSGLGGSANGCLSNLKSVGIGNHKMVPEAADAFMKMVEDMPDDIKKKMSIGSSYRPLKTQCDIFDFDYYEQTKKRRKKGTSGTPVAMPGTSNHGWGRALDVSPAKVQDWIRENGSKYGWCWGEVKSEPWHFTFCGAGNNKSKLCNTICKGGIDPSLSKPSKDSSSNTETTSEPSQTSSMGSLTDFFRSAYQTLKSTGMGQKQIQEINEDVDRISEIIKKVL